jgi:hypothetical protein
VIGLMYHPHERPLSTLPAALLDITSRLSNHLPFSLLPRSISSNLANPPPPSGPFKTLSSLSSSLAIPPIHVDQVAECVLRSIEHPQIKGVVDTKDMRRWMGLDAAEEGEEVVLPFKTSGGHVGQRGGHGKTPFRPSTGAREYSTAVGTRRSQLAGAKRGLKVFAPGAGREPVSSSGMLRNNDQGYIIEPPSPGREGSESTVTMPPSSGTSNQDQVIDAASVITASSSAENKNNGNGNGAMGRSNHPYASMPQSPLEGAMSDGQEPFTLLPPPAGFVAGQPGPSEGMKNETQGQDGGVRPEQSGKNPEADAHAQVGSTISPGAATLVPQHPSPAHPFDTHAFVTHLEGAGFTSPVAHSLMRSVRLLLLTRSTRAQSDLLHKEDVENAAYLFKAALSELRTELNVRARNDGLALRSATNLIRREVDALDQRMKEEVGGLKHE